MFVLISYDIEDDKLRAKVADVLEGHGRRVQYSVFECNLTHNQYDTLKQGLLRLVEGVTKTETYSIRFYRLCKACVERFETLGEGDISRDEAFYIV
ncbi:MAG: CRISPR-associated endonuclease Cas2 [Rhodothermales bacterium]